MVEKTNNTMYAPKNPVTQLVPLKIDSNNYNMWSKQFIMVLTSKGMLGYLNGDEIESDKDIYPTKHKK